VGLTEIAAQVKTILEGVEGIGPVHDFERFSTNWDEFLRQFQDEAGRINGCMFSRKATAAERDTMPTLLRSHKFVIRCIYGLKDSEGSERTFQALLEAIQGAFDSNHTLNGTVRDSGPAQIDLVENRMFGKVLCHWGEISFTAKERRAY